MENTETFLGQGWSFPPQFNKKIGELVTTNGEKDINESLKILLSTRLGERIMRPDYGSNLEEFLFSPLDLTLKTRMKDMVKTAILYHEPRIDVTKIFIDSINELDGEILIRIDYIIRITNSRTNMVFPFYLKEGTNL